MKQKVLHTPCSMLHEDGFTLMEVIIYIGLLSVIVSFVIVVLVQIVGSGNQNRDRIEVDSEANFLMQKMAWAMVGAQVINQPALNATSATLSVNKFNFSQNPIIFDLSGTSFRITKGTSTATVLNSPRVYVNQLTFKHNSASGNTPESVKISIKVVSADVERPVPASTTLDNTIYLKQ